MTIVCPFVAVVIIILYKFSQCKRAKETRPRGVLIGKTKGLNSGPRRGRRNKLRLR